MCICLRRWLDAEECSDIDINKPIINGNDKTLETKESNKTSSNSDLTKPEKSEIKSEKEGINDVKEQVIEKVEERKEEEKKLPFKPLPDKKKNENDDVKKSDKDLKDKSDVTNGEKSKPNESNKKDSSTNTDTSTSNGPMSQEERMEAFKKIEDIGKEFVNSMQDFPFIKSSTLKVQLGDGSGKDGGKTSVYHCDKGDEYDEVEGKRAMEEAEEKFRRAMREEEMEYNDDFFKMYIDEVTKGSKSGPVFVPGWPDDTDPRFFDEDNPLYDPDSKKEEWKSNLKLPDFQKFVRYSIEHYVKGDKGLTSNSATFSASFDLREPHFKSE